MKIYTIYDRKGHIYAENIGLLLFESDELFKRAVKLAFEQNQFAPMVKRYPEDFDFYCVGVIDRKTGKIEPCLDFVLGCSELVEGEKNA